jgi:hypothetical protein
MPLDLNSVILVEFLAIMP